MTLRSAIKALLILALSLPVVQCILIFVRGLVLSMGDQVGATIIGYVETGCLAMWSLSLVGLVIVLAVVALGERSPEDDTDR